MTKFVCVHCGLAANGKNLFVTSRHTKLAYCVNERECKERQKVKEKLDTLKVRL